MKRLILILLLSACANLEVRHNRVTYCAKLSLIDDGIVQTTSRSIAISAINEGITAGRTRSMQIKCTRPVTDYEKCMVQKIAPIGARIDEMNTGTMSFGERDEYTKEIEQNYNEALTHCKQYKPEDKIY